MSNEKHQDSQLVDNAQLQNPLKSDVNFEINSDGQLSLIERSELVVTLPRYSPSSDVTTALDTEPIDQETLRAALDSPTEGAMALVEETGRSSSLHSETSDLTQNLAATTDDQINSDEFTAENSSLVVYQPIRNNVIENQMRQLCESGRALMETGDYCRAVVCYTKSLTLRPKDVVCMTERAECYLRLADFQSAIVNYKKACLLLPGDVTYRQRLALIYYLYGQCLFEQKQLTLALESFERASDLDRENVWFQYRSIACLAALDRYGECLAVVSSHLTDRLLDPNNIMTVCQEMTADLYVLRARIHAKLGNQALCYYDTRDALHLDPDHSKAREILQVLEDRSVDLKNQSVRLTITGRNSEALQRLTSAIEVDPTNPELLIHRGSVFRRLGNYNAAIDDYLLAINNAGCDVQSEFYRRAKRHLLLTYNDFAVECCQKQFYDEAIALLNKAIIEEKSEKGLYLNRGDCFFRQGNMTFALADYLQALEMDPTNFVIHERISEIHAFRANVLFRNKRYEETETKISVAIQYHPLSSDYYTLRSKTRELLATIEGAQRDAIVALFLDQSNRDVVSLMARLYPGKSIREIMSSVEAVSLKQKLDQLTACRKPKLLSQRKPQFDNIAVMERVSKSIELRMTERDEVKGKKISGTALMLDQPRISKEIKDLQWNLEENEFYSGIVKEKKKMKSLVHRTFHGPMDLKNNRFFLPSQPTTKKKKATRHPNRQSVTLATQQQLPDTRWNQLKLESSS